MKQNLAVSGRLIVGGIFMVSGFIHAVNPPQEFAAIIESYMFLPQEYILNFATILPWVELFSGVFLLAGYRTRLSAAVTGTMLLMFETALIWAKTNKIPLDHCGCFGSDIPLTPTETMILDAVLLGLVFAAFRHGRERLSVDQWIDQGA